MVSQDPLENLKRIKDDIYLVWTQAGFRAAIKRMHDSENCSYDGAFPNRYPALVSFRDDYRGYHRLTCSILYMDELEGVLQTNKEHLAKTKPQFPQNRVIPIGLSTF